MTTVLSPVLCHDCKATVHVVRRTVEVPCFNCGCDIEHLCSERPHTHAIPDTAWVVVDDDGERHRCGEAAA